MSAIIPTNIRAVSMKGSIEMLEYNYSWRNGPQPPAPQVYVNNQNTFNDYLQTGLLAANLVVMEDIRQLLREAATARKLQWWESVVRHRFPAITDPMAVRDSAQALMAWDQRETSAQQDRLTGRQNQHFRHGWNWWNIFVALFCGSVFGGFVLVITWFVLEVFKESDPFNRVESTGGAALMVMYLFWVPFVVLIIHQVSKMFTGYPPAFDPTSKSVICRQFRPGQMIKSLSGQTHIVKDWPVYQSERLSFWIPVHRATNETVPVGQGFGLECDKVVWHR